MIPEWICSTVKSGAFQHRSMSDRMAHQKMTGVLEEDADVGHLVAQSRIFSAAVALTMV